MFAAPRGKVTEWSPSSTIWTGPNCWLSADSCSFCSVWFTKILNSGWEISHIVIFDIVHDPLKYYFFFHYSWVQEFCCWKWISSIDFSERYMCVCMIMCRSNPSKSSVFPKMNGESFHWIYEFLNANIFCSWHFLLDWRYTPNASTTFLVVGGRKIFCLSLSCFFTSIYWRQLKSWKKTQLETQQWKIRPVATPSLLPSSLAPDMFFISTTEVLLGEFGLVFLYAQCDSWGLTLIKLLHCSTWEFIHS